MLTQQFQWFKALLIMLAMSLATSAARAEVDVAGVKFADTLELKGSKLQLNGAGIRTKAIFKVYAAGLYLPSKAATPELALAMQGAKSIRITMLRDIEAQELGNLLVRGIEANSTRDEFFKFAIGFQRMGDIFTAQKKLKSGDSFSIDYVPNVGTTIIVKGTPQGEPFKEQEFFSALLKIWLGNKPADNSLKQALLGKTADAPRNPSRDF
jgi:Chalcone isomerase-like